MLYFIPPCLPTLRDRLPIGPQWSYEVKADGWRVQVIKEGRNVRLLSRNRKAIAVPALADALAALPARAAILDGELVGDLSDFWSVRSRIAQEPEGLSVLAFDLLHLNGRDLRPLPLSERRKRLGGLIEKAALPALVESRVFRDGEKLFDACEANRLEGIVAKRDDAPYRSGRRPEWIKAKCPTWRAVNRNRWRVFA